MEESKFRNKITWFSFICCVLVIWNHAGNAELFLGGEANASPLFWFEYNFYPALIRINIPFFLMISGYLFYRSFEWSSLKGKWSRRIRTLLVPYLIWNILYYGAYVLATRLPILKPVIGKPEIPLTLPVFWEAAVKFEFNPVFWFMYQLILLVILAPVLWMFLKRAETAILLLLFPLLVISLGYSLPELNADALFYYSAGAFAAVHLRKQTEGSYTARRGRLGLILILAAMPLNYLYYRCFLIPATVLYNVMVPAGLWLLTDENRLGRVRPFMTCTFFIYAFHFIPVRFINKAGALLLPGSGTAAFLLFLLMPLAAVPICFLAVRILRRLAPRLFGLLNGGR